MHQAGHGIPGSARCRHSVVLSFRMERSTTRLKLPTYLPATHSRANTWSSHPLPRVHEDETSRAIGALRLPFAEARLPEKGRLARVRDEEKRHPTVNTHTQTKKGVKKRSELRTKRPFNPRARAASTKKKSVRKALKTNTNLALFAGEVRWGGVGRGGVG